MIFNPLKMNDWEITSFLKTIFVIQILFLIIILLDNWGWYIPILRQIIPLVYLLFVPGILILRIIKVHNISTAEVLLYSTGLSITSVMFIGFTINLFYPLLGVLNPISLWPLIITVSVFVMLLSILSYWRDKDYANPDFIDSNVLLSPYVLFLFLLPFTAIFGTYLMNLYKINILISVLFILIFFVVILFAYNKIPRKLYPFTIIIISISLLFQTSLISNYVTGFDIQGEYYLATLVVKNALWNFNLNSDYNSLLSDTVLPPILSIILKLDLDWIFKIIYPLLYSVVPLGLYIIFKKQTSERIAFLSSFFFMSFYVFYTEMLALARQEIAEIFLVLLILVMITGKMSNVNRSFLLIIFGLSLVASHYGISYFYMFSLLIVYILILFNEHYNIRNRFNQFFRINKAVIVKNKISKNKIISFTFVLFFIITALSWYMYTSSETSLIIFISLIKILANSITTQFLNPSSVQGLAVIQQSFPPLQALLRYGEYLIELFIVIGVISIFLRDGMKFRREYLAFILINILIQIASVSVPYFSNALDTERLYHITLIFLAPACIIGGLTTLDIIYRVLTYFKIQIKNSNDNKIKVLSIYFTLFLLFSSGFLFYWTNENSNSIAFNSTYDSANYNIMEIQGANWLNTYGFNLSNEAENNSNSSIIITDDYRRPLMVKYGLDKDAFTYSDFYDSNFSVMNQNIMSFNQNKTDFYFFMGTNNILTNLFAVKFTKTIVINETYISPNNFNSLNRIYESDGAQIFYESS